MVRMTTVTVQLKTTKGSIRGYTKLLIPCFTFLFWLSCLTVSYGLDAVTVNYPPDQTIMEFGLVGISLSVPEGSADSITVSVNGSESLVIIPDSTFECFSVPLDVGVNRIIIRSSKNGKQDRETSINVFQRSDLESRYTKPPPGYSKSRFHTRERAECKGCHVLEHSDFDRKSLTVTAFSPENQPEAEKPSASSSTCYSCHRSITSYPFVHAPSAVWSCLSCHNPQAVPKYSVRKPDTKACFNCHLEQKELWYSRKVVHGPFNTGKCAICHNPHASDFPFDLIKSTWNLCVSCHIEKGSGRHIVEGYFPGPGIFHPTRGKPDPLRLGKELSCASCHDPHASDAPKLWRLNVGSGFELCASCHNK